MGAARIAELADALGVAELIDRAVGSYSGGQRRRLEIARALVSQPRVLFLDEPTVGLDPRIRHELLDAIAALRGREEMTIVLTTHYLEEAERLCDRVAIIHGGAIVALDTPAALLAGLGGELLELRVDGDVSAALARARRPRRRRPRRLRRRLDADGPAARRERRRRDRRAQRRRHRHQRDLDPPTRPSTTSTCS